MKKMYVGCALTGTPKEFRDQIAHIKELIRLEYPTVEVLEFLGLSKGTAIDVYEYDIDKCVKGCDFFLAICSSISSLGLGFEIAEALREGKRVLVVAPTSVPLSRLIIGAVEKHGKHARLVYYDDLVDVMDILRRVVEVFESENTQRSNWKS